MKIYRKMPNSTRSFITFSPVRVTINNRYANVHCFDQFAHVLIIPALFPIYRPISSSSSKKKSSSEVRVTNAVSSAPFPYTAVPGAISNSVSPASRGSSNSS